MSRCGGEVRQGSHLPEPCLITIRDCLSISLDSIRDVPGGKVNTLGGHNIGHSKQKVYMYMNPIPNGFRDRAISLYSSVIVDMKIYYILFLITVFIVQVTKLVQFT
jgi:hypothetical protein